VPARELNDRVVLAQNTMVPVTQDN
jgi:hypothetical protein